MGEVTAIRQPRTITLVVPVPYRADINLDDVDIAVHMATFETFATYVDELRLNGFEMTLAASSDLAFLTAKGTSEAELPDAPDVKITVFSPHFPLVERVGPDAEALLAEQLARPEAA